jgi:hypothetical protein
MSDVTFLVWVLLGATLALAGVIVAYKSRLASQEVVDFEAGPCPAE